MLGGLPTRSATPSVHLTYPHPSLFTFPPASVPEVLPPPTSDHTLARPFAINPETYNNLLSVNYPITIALLYATTVTLVNRINKQRGYKPWAFSQSYAFYAFVLLHNVFLAVYSVWTFVGMFNALRHAWPGLHGKDGLAGVADALCKIHGPRGLGNAVTYNSTNSIWGATNEAIKLATGGSPDTTDVGRIWNEGLSYYGWLFYLSKFYEIMDTAIVLAKGKKSSLLQTYHHTGAMLCMWAGIRYMAPPIWVFALVNSGVHSMMYTYYALSAIGVRVPQAVKRTLTTLQISQFVIGSTFAIAHLFISYDIPVSVPYLFVHNLTSAIPKAASSVSSAVSSVTASVGVGAWVKKMAFRAAGEEGLAENVRNSQGETFGIDAVHAHEAEKAREEIRYRNEYQTVPCVDTSGQAFAILLNVFYLAPLTWLFVDFFIRSYLRRTSSSTKRPTHDHVAEKSRHDAKKGIERELREAMDEDQSRGDVHAPRELSTELDDLKSNIKHGVDNLSFKAQQGAGKVQELANKGRESAKDAVDYAQKKLAEGKTGAKDAMDKAQPQLEHSKENLKDSAGKAQNKFEQGKEEAKVRLQKAQETLEQGRAKAQDGLAKAGEKAEQGKAVAKDGVQKAQEKSEQGKAVAKDGIEKGQKKAEQGKAAAKDGLDRAGQKAEQGKAATKDTAEKAQGKAEQGKDAAKEGTDKAQKKAEHGKSTAKEGADKAQNKADQGRATAKEGLDRAQSKAGQAKADAGKAGDNAEHDHDHDTSDGELISRSEHEAARAYEANPDDVKDEAEKEAERKMQPQPQPQSKGEEGKEGEDADEGAKALEASIDEVTNRDEKAAEKKMQPNGSRG